MLSRRLLLAGMSATALIGAALPASAQEKLPVIASFSIVGDLVKQVAGEDAAVTILVGPDGDGHVYQPTPQDAKNVAAAKLIVINGLGFEGWMPRLVKSSATKGTIIEAAKGIVPLKAADDHDHKPGHKHDHGAVDPHAWHDIGNVKIYVENIAAALAKADPAHAEGYRQRAAAYQQELTKLDADVKAAMNAINPEKRKVITSHDAFGYLGRAYKISFLSPQGVSTESEASAKDVATLIRQMKTQKIKAVFVENISDRRLTDQISREAGGIIGGTLYSDALSRAGGPADSYLSMMRYNTRQLAEAMAAN